MKKIRMILGIILIVLAGLMVARNVIVNGIVTMVVPQVLGTPVKLEHLQIGLFRPVIQIKGFKLYNPAGFPKEIFVDIPEIKVEYDLGAILAGKMHLPLVVLNLKEVVLVKNQEGKLNAESLKVLPQKDAKKEPAKKTEPLSIQIDVLQLDLGKVIVKDYSHGPAPVIRGYDVGVHNKTYRDIKSVQQLTALVLLEAMGPAGMKTAGIYAAATVLGVAFLPAGVAGMLIGKDSGVAEYNADFEKVFQSARQVLESSGKILSENKEKGVIKANIKGADVMVTISRGDGKKVKMVVSARKYLMPRPEIAQGVLYQISERLK